MKVPELKTLAKERGLRRYSKLRKAELIALIQEGDPPPPPSTPPPQHSQRGVEGNQGGVRFRPDRPRQPELLEERQSNPLTARQMKRRRNELNKLNEQVKSSERELEDLKSKRDSIMDKIEGARKIGTQKEKEN